MIYPSLLALIAAGLVSAESPFLLEEKVANATGTYVKTKIAEFSKDGKKTKGNSEQQKCNWPRLYKGASGELTALTEMVEGIRKILNQFQKRASDPEKIADIESFRNQMDQPLDKFQQVRDKLKPLVAAIEKYSEESAKKKMPECGEKALQKQNGFRQTYASIQNEMRAAVAEAETRINAHIESRKNPAASVKNGHRTLKVVESSADTPEIKGHRVLVPTQALAYRGLNKVSESSAMSQNEEDDVSTVEEGYANHSEDYSDEQSEDEGELNSDLDDVEVSKEDTEEKEGSQKEGDEEEGSENEDSLEDDFSEGSVSK